MAAATTTVTTAAHAAGVCAASLPTRLATQRPGPAHSDARLQRAAAFASGANAARPPASRYPADTVAAAAHAAERAERVLRRTAIHVTTPASGTTPTTLISAPRPSTRPTTPGRLPATTAVTPASTARPTSTSLCAPLTMAAT